MAGIGVRLNRIFEKNTITTNLIGFSYSTVVTIAPMMVVIFNLILMEELLEFSSVAVTKNPTVRENSMLRVVSHFMRKCRISARTNATSIPKKKYCEIL